VIKPVVSWVVVADASQARVLVNDGPSHGLTVQREFQQEVKKSRDVLADRPGSTNDSMGVAKHATSPPDQVREQKRKFAREIANDLDAARKHNEFERLYLVAPPQILGELRAELTPELTKMVAGELNKDLTKVPLQDLPDHLGSLLPV
jgi:protein required for attachment to host cells